MEGDGEGDGDEAGWRERGGLGLSGMGYGGYYGGGGEGESNNSKVEGLKNSTVSATDPEKLLESSPEKKSLGVGISNNAYFYPEPKPRL